MQHRPGRIAKCAPDGACATHRCTMVGGFRDGTYRSAHDCSAAGHHELAAPARLAAENAGKLRLHRACGRGADRRGGRHQRGAPGPGPLACIARAPAPARERRRTPPLSPLLCPPLVGPCLEGRDAAMPYPSLPWARMGGRAVEGTGLENRQALTRLVGSNPTPSARAFSQIRIA